MPLSRGSSQPGAWTHVSCSADRFFTAEPLGKSLQNVYQDLNFGCCFFISRSTSFFSKNAISLHISFILFLFFFGKVTSLFYFFKIFFSLFLFFYFLYCSGFCHTLKWNSHGFTCVPHPDPPTHLPLHLIPLGLPSAPGPSACLMHPTWAGDLFHSR